MSTFTPYNVLAKADYENIKRREPWTEKSFSKPIAKMSFKNFIYSFGEYALSTSKPFSTALNEGYAELTEEAVEIMRAYYKIASEMNLTYFQFDAHFIGLQYTPSEEAQAWYNWMDNTIEEKIKEYFDIKEDVTSFQLHMLLKEIASL